MKFIYIAGIEHSGTTLTEQLLSSHPNVLSLGEINSFFSPSHMRNYMGRWGSHEDVSLCSCGKEWSQCAFWSERTHLSGLNSTRPTKEKYLSLIEDIASHYGPDLVVTDSSKSLAGLLALHEASRAAGNAVTEIGVIFTVKDPRSFASSMKRKTRNEGLLASYRAMSLWAAGNREIMAYVQQNTMPVMWNLYEHLCLDPLGQINSFFRRIGAAEVGQLDVSNQNSHIAMGNKDFLMRNRRQIRYDQRWFLDNKIHIAYLLHGKVQELNRTFYALSEQQRREVLLSAGESPAADPTRSSGA